MANNLVARFVQPVNSSRFEGGGFDPRHFVLQEFDQVLGSLNFLRFNGCDVTSLIHAGDENRPCGDVVFNNPPDMPEEDPALDCSTDSKGNHHSASCTGDWKAVRQLFIFL